MVVNISHSNYYIINTVDRRPTSHVRLAADPQTSAVVPLVATVPVETIVADFDYRLTLP